MLGRRKAGALWPYADEEDAVLDALGVGFQWPDNGDHIVRLLPPPNPGLTSCCGAHVGGQHSATCPATTWRGWLPIAAWLLFMAVLCGVLLVSTWE